MTNTNCLEGIRCPKCGQEERFLIVATVTAEVTDDGADIASPMYGNGFESDDESRSRCPDCDHEGLLAEFRLEPETGRAARVPIVGFAYGFYQHSRAWYAEASKLPSDVAEEVMIGLYADGGGCRWEFGIRWIRLPELTPRVEVFSDAWQAFAQVPELFTELTKLDRLTPAECCGLLTRLGFVDKTPTERPS